MAANDSARDSVFISPKAEAALRKEENQKTTGQQLDKDNKDNNETTKSTTEEELDPQELELLKQLQKTDQKVRKHEQAHMSAAGQYALGGPNYQFQTGPDGKRYAVAGDMSIDSGNEHNPAHTVRKMDAVKKAALAPIDPSPQDRRVAASASQKKLHAMMELQQLQSAEQKLEAAEAKEEKQAREAEDKRREEEQERRRERIDALA